MNSKNSKSKVQKIQRNKGNVVNVRILGIMQKNVPKHEIISNLNCILKYFDWWCFFIEKIRKIPNLIR